MAESDKGCAIVIGTILEAELRSLHEAHICINTSSLEVPRELFKNLAGPYGPLSTFAGMIQIAYAYGLISKQDHQDLELIRAIRNEAAHSLYDFSFQDAGVWTFVKRLEWESRVPKDESIGSDSETQQFMKLTDERQVFILAGMGLQGMLLEKAREALKSVVDREKRNRKQRLQNDNSAAAALLRARSDE